MIRHIVHMRHDEKYAIANDILKVMRKHGAVSYGIAKELLDYTDNLAKNSAVLAGLDDSAFSTAFVEPLPSQKTLTVTTPTGNEVFFDKVGIEMLDDAQCDFDVRVGPDQALILSVTVMALRRYATAVDVPFSDFSENLTSISDFKRFIIDALHGSSIQEVPGDGGHVK